MTELFITMMNMSLAAGWAVLVVLFLRMAMIIMRVPRSLVILLWGVIAVRLICPVALESVISLLPSGEVISPDIMMYREPIIHTGILPVNTAVNSWLTGSLAPAPGDSVNPLQIWIPVLSFVWILGIIAMVIYTILSYIFLSRRLETAVLLRGRIFRSEQVDSPFVFGLITPKIYLPFHMDREILPYVEVHEEAHIRRKDYWWKLFGFLLLSVYWFHPLIWIAYVLFCRDIEFACDETVIAKLKKEEQAEYLQALLLCSIGKRNVNACPLAFGETEVKKRAYFIVTYKKTAFGVIAIAVIASLITAVCLLTNPVRQADKLTLEKVFELADEKDGELTWTDFEGYGYRVTGFGLYIRSYEIDDRFNLLIGGGSTEEKPMYVRLGVDNGKDWMIDDSIEITDEGVIDFIEKYKTK